jgi:hypothetical protein
MNTWLFFLSLFFFFFFFLFFFFLFFFFLFFFLLCSQVLDLASGTFYISGRLDRLRRLHVGTCYLNEIVP